MGRGSEKTKPKDQPSQASDEPVLSQRGPPQSSRCFPGTSCPIGLCNDADDDDDGDKRRRRRRQTTTATAAATTTAATTTTTTTVTATTTTGGGDDEFFDGTGAQIQLRTPNVTKHVRRDSFEAPDGLGPQSSPVRAF